MDAKLAKAERTLRTARLAFGDGDFDSTCNRAYYAMFYAARAALLAIGHADAAIGKSHSGMIASVGRHLIIPGLLPASLSSSLGKASKRRLLVDYQGDGATVDDAAEALTTADQFLDEVQKMLDRHPPSTAAHFVN